MVDISVVMEARMVLVVLNTGTMVMIPPTSEAKENRRLNLVVLQSPGATILVLLKVLHMGPHQVAVTRDHDHHLLRHLSSVERQSPGAKILVLHKVLRLVHHRAAMI